MRVEAAGNGKGKGLGAPASLGGTVRSHGACAVSRAHLLFQGIQIPQGHTWDVWATPSIFVPQYSKVSLKRKA